jgi:hypothetical protein
LAGQIKVDSINADSNLALKIANTAVAFIDSSGLRPISGNVNLDATATSKLYLPSANTVAIQTAGVTGLSISSSQVVTLANALAVTSGGTGVTTSTGTGAVVLGTAPTITGANITVAATAAPAFSAYRSGTQAYTTNTYTKIQLNIESFDTNSNYDNATNYRFTPTVAGYYLCTGQIQTSAGTYVETNIYKNGVSNGLTQISGAWGIPTTQLIYFNGSTDYIELYGFITTSGNIASGLSTYFQAFLARSA